MLSINDVDETVFANNHGKPLQVNIPSANLNATNNLKVISEQPMAPDAKTYVKHTNRPHLRDNLCKFKIKTRIFEY